MTVKLGYRFAAIPEWILYHPELTGEHIRVFGVLARYGNDIRPSVARIAEAVGKSDTSVKNYVRKLAAVGAVVVEHRFEDGTQLPNRYHLAGDRPLDAEAVCEPGGVVYDPRGSADEPGGGVVDEPPRGSPVDPKREPDNESQDNETPLSPPDGGAESAKKPRKRAAAVEPVHPEEFEEFWNQYPHARSNRAAAVRRWNNFTRAQHRRILETIPGWCAYWAAKGTSPEWLPAAEVWLGTDKSRHYFESMVPEIPKPNGREAAPDVVARARARREQERAS